MDSANMGDAAAFVMARDLASAVPAVYLSETLGTGKSIQWKFHLVKHHREDLWRRTRYLQPDSSKASAIPSGSLLVMEADNPRLNALVAQDGCTVVQMVTSVTNQPTAAILRRR
jgi:hypothetical protein